MASSLLELTANIVSSHASMSEMTREELLQEIQNVHAALLKLEEAIGETAGRGELKAPVITLKKAFQPDQVICMICGKGGMKTLTRHLAKEHGLKPGAYRKQYGIPRAQSLTAKNFSDARRKMALDRGLAENLAKARAIKAANLKAAKPQPEMAGKPVKTAKPVKTGKPVKAKAAPKAKKA
ncbi:MAG: MucR family transcriptional regulator [Geobacteraceae bacterium]